MLSFVCHPAKQSTSSLVHLQVKRAGQRALPATQGFWDFATASLRKPPTQKREHEIEKRRNEPKGKILKEQKKM